MINYWSIPCARETAQGGSKTASGVFEDIGQNHARQIRPKPLEPRRESQSSTTTTASGVPYYGFRYYNPDTGRWLNRDPLGEAGGPNLYAFVDNDPVGAIDPLGLQSMMYYFGLPGRPRQLPVAPAIEERGRKEPPGSPIELVRNPYTGKKCEISYYNLIRLNDYAESGEIGRLIDQAIAVTPFSALNRGMSRRGDSPFGDSSDFARRFNGGNGLPRYSLTQDCRWLDLQHLLATATMFGSGTGLPYRLGELKEIKDYIDPRIHGSAFLNEDYYSNFQGAFLLDLAELNNSSLGDAAEQWLDISPTLSLEEAWGKLCEPCE